MFFLSKTFTTTIIVIIKFVKFVLLSQFLCGFILQATSSLGGSSFGVVIHCRWIAFLIEMEHLKVVLAQAVVNLEESINYISVTVKQEWVEQLSEL